MNKYKVIFNYQREISKMETKADSNYKAIMKCIPVMAKKYCVTKETMIRYFTSERLNCQAQESGGKKKKNNVNN